MKRSENRQLPQASTRSRQRKKANSLNLAPTLLNGLVNLVSNVSVLATNKWCFCLHLKRAECSK